ncbi:MAG: alpha/beta hydrolase [Propioniciclava sp.]|uniref:alpha/beta fold hydrolase n=1 Tax=Propioniciclava sp. TaxID=2038686 RepID=UPI0039E3B1C3
MRVSQEFGQVAVEVEGNGPLVVCVPGMGESRASFRHLLPGLAAAGYRAAAMDLRGHGDSAVEFDAYDDPATARDILAVIEALGGRAAAVIGNSMGAAAAVIAAAENPDAVGRLVLIGPFVRDHGPAAMRGVMRALLAKPWGPAVWSRYHASLFGERRPDDHDEQLRRTHALLRRPGRWRAFQQTARTSHAPAEAMLGRVASPALVVMGERDPDFRDPEAEAVWIAQALRGQHRMIPGAGHYPQAEQADAVLAEVLAFLAEEGAHG